MSRIVYAPREARKNRSVRIALPRHAWIAGFAVAAMAVGAAATMVPAVQLTDVKISGLQTLDEAAVRRHVGNALNQKYLLLFPRSSYFLANTAALAAGLRASFPAISAVAAEKEFPRMLTVRITERTFWAIMCPALRQAAPDLGSASEPSSESELISAPAQCAALDDTGFTYEPAPLPQGNLLLVVEADRAVIPGETRLDADLAADMRSVQEGVREATGRDPVRLELRERVPGEIRARAADGYMIWFKRGEDMANTVRVLKKVLDAEIGGKGERLDYIDVRFGNKVFYKFR